MTVELISVGTEILLGNIVNTNAAYLSEKCACLGLSLYYETTVGDNENRLKSALTTALSRSDIVILTGGLGPTGDDLTKEVTAKVLGLNLVLDSHTKERINEYFKKIDSHTIPESNWKQAKAIEGAIIIDNTNGTAPGLIVETKDEKRVILLPGPPGEMIPMFEKDIYPYLNKLMPHVFYSAMVKICGIGESKVEEEIRDLMERQMNPTIAPYAKTGEVHLRITASADTAAEGEKLVEPVVLELKKRFKDNIYTTKENETLEENVVKLLIENNITVAAAESCTGGLFTGKIVDVSGASKILNASFITYSNEAKAQFLNVSEETLKNFGAVSEKTAAEMAAGAAKAANSKAAIGITGLAGPLGGTKEKPVGLVYIGCYLDGEITVKEYHFQGNRKKIREYSVVNALDLLRRCIINKGRKKLSI